MVQKLVAVRKVEEGYLVAEATSGSKYRRRYKEYKKGRFAGKVTFNVWDNVYSFDARLARQQFVVSGEEIKYEGRYVDIYKKTDREAVRDVRELEEAAEKAKQEVEEKAKEWVEKPVRHEKYESIKCCVENNVPVYLVGPAGSGKNFTLEQIAKENDWDFFFSNSVQQEYKLTGFIDAGGDYHETEFYKACTSEKECLFFLDEMDASIPEVLVLLNAAIANGYFEFPNGKIEFGDKVHFVAAGNTFGNGADEQYTGRLVLDQATLDRFAVIDFGYDMNVEMNLAKGNVELVSFIRQLREKAEATGIRATFSYRCITMVTKLEKCLKLEQVLKMAVLKGFDKDTVNTLFVEGNTKYHRAMNEIRRAA